MYKKGTSEYDLWRGTPEYDLWRERISMARKGKPFSEKHKRNLSVAHKGRPRLDLRGKPRSDETKKKLSAAHMGKHHSEETKQKISIGNKGKLVSEETGQKISAAKKGKPVPNLCGSNHPNWHGGVSFEPYPINWTKHFRETIRKRDNYTCILCGKPQGKRRHSIHHINYVKGDLCLENLVTLCSDCHRKTNDDREYWENLFMMVYVPDFPELIAVS